MDLNEIKITVADTVGGRNAKTISLSEGLNLIANSADNQRREKKTLPVLIYGCTVGKDLKDITGYSGVIGLDVDCKAGENEHLRNKIELENAKNKLLAMPNVIACHGTYSGNGLRVLFLQDGIECKNSFKAAFNNAKKLVEAETGLAVDASGCNPNRTSFISSNFLNLSQAVAHPPVPFVKYEGDAGDDFDTVIFESSDENRTRIAVDILERTKVEDFGGRDNTLFNTAIRLKETGIPEAEAISLMYAHLYEKIDWSEDLPPSTIDDKVKSVYKDDKFKLGKNSFEALFKDFLQPVKRELTPDRFGFAGLADLEAEELKDYNPEDDFYIIPRIALKGEITTIFAKANSGKTLILLAEICKNAEAIKAAGITVIYLNLDDSKRGHVEKKAILANNGMKALMSGGFLKIREVLGCIREYSKHPEIADKTVIIIDTGKKVINQSDKHEAMQSYVTLREFCGLGGTVIMAAHTNKNKGDDGKYVFEGFSDNISDVDRTLIVQKVNKDESGFAELAIEVDKVRSGLEISGQLLHYSYGGTDKIKYIDKFNSVKFVDKDLAARQENALEYQQRLTTDYVWLEVIERELMEEPDAPISRLIEIAKERKALPKDARKYIIDYYEGKRWDIVQVNIKRQKHALRLRPDRIPLVGLVE